MIGSDLLSIALEALKTNRLRSSLTILGLVIGVASVMIINTIGNGGKTFLNNEFSKMGNNRFWAYPSDLLEGKRPPAGALRLSDVELLKEKVPDIEYLTPTKRSSTMIDTPQKRKTATLSGVNEDVFAIRSNLSLAAGRFLNNSDVNKQRKVAVIPEEAAKEIFPDKNPIGETISLDGLYMTIIGTYSEDKVKLDMNQGWEIYVPITCVFQMAGNNEIDMLEGTTVNQESAKQTMDRVGEVLKQAHKGEVEYLSQTLQSEASVYTTITSVISGVLMAIAGISLLVGGVGVMNIMLASVRERTWEIGLRKAIGATRVNILAQFLVESLILCLVGGAIGIIGALGLVKIAAFFMGIEAPISWWGVAGAFGFTLLISLGSGLYPASKAAKLDPIEALRY